MADFQDWLQDMAEDPELIAGDEKLRKDYEEVSRPGMGKVRLVGMLWPSIVPVISLCLGGRCGWGGRWGSGNLSVRVSQRV